MKTFQNLISTLKTFWAEKGCIIHEGYDLEVGAGTFNPVTFFRCLGPEPYSTAYVEPCRRPTDGRYGENPNRMQLFHQFQVIIKPSPDDIQQLYLDSLKACGLDISQHDIRFVHDDWESPTLGAWGLGWEVWLDGMEITQFTYFQGMASLPLNPVSVEITYGLERLAMVLQNVTNIYEVQWNDSYTLNEIVQRNEYEFTHYNFSYADVSMWQRHFEDFEREAQRVIAEGYPLPGYDFVMKASHAFNMLQARGSISTTQRTGYIARIRDLARGAAEAYLLSREAQGFPLLAHLEPSHKPLSLEKYVPSEQISRDFILEIGSEELPASYVPKGIESLRVHCTKWLEAHHIAYESLQVEGTPRRLAVFIKNLAHYTTPQSTEKKGPSLEQSFLPNGELTKQGLGFLQGCGKSAISKEILLQGIAGIGIKTINGIDYLFATIEKPAECVGTLLQQSIASIITSLQFPKKMHWGTGSFEYPRPLQWIVCLHGRDIIPCNVGEVVSANYSFGHRQRDNCRFVIPHAREYFQLLEAHKVLVSVSKRKDQIMQMLSSIEEFERASATEISRVLQEVLFLTEWPELVSDRFDPAFLSIPSKVLISEMVEHQRYFPLMSDGSLISTYVITADTTPTEKVILGNRRVLSARLNDGVFLYKQDLKKPLSFYVEKLKSIVLHTRLGSIFDKMERLQAVATNVQTSLQLSRLDLVQRAAFLSKADLATDMVGEFPELQGYIGKEYALRCGEDPEVSSAIYEHWLPNSEGGELPQTKTGVCLALAEKIETLSSYFSIGLRPTSSSDPYALRRQALGLLRIVLHYQISCNLLEQIRFALELVQCFSIETAREVLFFIEARAKILFEELGFSKDEIEACFQGDFLNPYETSLKLIALRSIKTTPSFQGLLEVFKRSKGFLSKHSKTPLNPDLFETAEERALFEAVVQAKQDIAILEKSANYAGVLLRAADLKDPLEKFLSGVKVLDDRSEIRAVRLALLQEVLDSSLSVANLSKLHLG